MSNKDYTFFQQKYPETALLSRGAGTTFDKYDWAFNSEDTDPEILSQCNATLNNPDASDEDKQNASYVVNRDGIKKQLQIGHKLGRIGKAVDEGNESAELVGFLDLLGLTQADESIEESCRIHCGGKTPKETLKYFRENFKAHIENGDTEAEKFSAMSDGEKRKFISRLRETDLTEKGEDTTVYDSMGLPVAGHQEMKVREMSEAEYGKWSKEYLGNTKYKKFWNMISHSGERNVRLGLALSMTNDAESQKAFIPALQSLPKEDREEIYYVAHEFNPEVGMWNLLKDDFIQSWAEIPQAIKNGYDWVKTTPLDLKQYVDSHGGLDKIMSDEKTKDEFRNKFFVAESGVSLGFNRFVLPDGGGDNALRDYTNRIYDMGKGALELRTRYDEIQTAMKTKYASKGYVADHIIQGVSFGIQFGQFAVGTIATGGTATALRYGATGLSIASKTDKFVKAGKAASLASKAQKLTYAANIADNASYYSRWANKLVVPYFGAMMSVDAQKEAQKVGFTDEQSFVLGAGIGVVNSFLEKIQFGIRSKNIFLGEKVIRAIENRKDILKTVTTQYCVDGIKNRGKHFGEEYLVENLQNVVQEVGLALGGYLSDKEYKEASSIIDDLLFQAKDMIIPLFTATNMGAGTNFGKSLRTFAQAETFGKDIVALHSFNAAMQMNEAMAKMQEANLPTLTPKTAQRYFNATTEEERAVILSRSGMNAKERGKAKKVLSDMEVDLKKHGESLVKAVEASVANSPEIAGLLTDGKTLVNHEKNKAFIADFSRAYGIEEEIVYLESMNDAPDTVKKEAQERGGTPDGFRREGKIYIVGDVASTPQRTLEILKHESGHRGAEGIRAQKEFKNFLDNLIAQYGGEEVVRLGIQRAKGDVYSKEDKYKLGEEFMCMLAEKVAGKNELTQEELSTWAKVRDFFTELLSGIPQNEKARDRYIANMIRAIWGREYLGDIPVDEDFFGDSETEESGTEEMKKEVPVSEELASNRADKAKKAFRAKIAKRRIFERKLTDEERETEQRKLEIQEFLDSIPDEEISDKLEAIGAIEDEDLLSDEILQYAAEHGAKWAEKSLEERLNEREKAELDKEGDSLLDVIKSNSIKLPTPKAIITDCKNRGLPLSGTLFGEINDIYNSLNFYQKQKYFTAHYVDIDDLANVLASEHNFPYEGSADFLSDFAENIWGQKETRFSFANVEEQIKTPQFKEWFSNSQVVDENGKPLHVFHGTSRGDRVGYIFDPQRAISGPMAMFTDNKAIATNYSTGKRDTSIEKDGLLLSFDNRFVMKFSSGLAVPFSKAWGYMDFAKRRDIIEKSKHITLDDEAENIVYDENAMNGVGNYDYNLNEARGNGFLALVNEWLESGNLFREDEKKFLDVLRLAGIDGVEFLDPYKQDSKVYDVFLRIENPFDTSNLKKSDIAGLKRSAKKAQKTYNPDDGTATDAWDKTMISPEDWIAKFEEDVKNNTTLVWTQIPDWVTDYLKSKGYDGIKDSGGKNNDIGHTVWIPFDSTQIKDATGENNGDFSRDNPDIRFSFANKNLIVSHNISEANLISSAKLGGLPMPSLAVRRTDINTGGFGDISLIAPKGILSDKNAKTYQGDMWSPTYPKRVFVVDSRAERKRVVELLKIRYQKAGLDFEENSVYLDFQQRYSPEEIVRGLGDLQGREKAMDSSEWQKDMIKYLDIKGEYKLFAGFTNMGREKLIPETIDNVVKLMKKRDIRGDAGAFRGVSSLKATLIKKLNPKQVSKNRDSIKDFKTVEAERDKFFKEHCELVNELEEVGKYLEKDKQSNPLGVLDRHATHIQEMAYEGIDAVNRDFYDGKIPQELKNKIADFFKRLANSSVPYFESKVKRAMSLNEFAGAVIPNTASTEVRKILDENNIPYREYENQQERERITDEFTNELDAGSENIRFSFKTLEKLKNAKPVEITKKTYEGKYELNVDSAFGYVMSTLRKGNPYHIDDTSEDIEISQIGAKKISSHDRYDEDYLKTFAAIPDMIKSAIYLGEEPNAKKNGKWEKYRYYACGLKIDGIDYTARLTIGVKGAKKYYDQSLSKIEKGLLIDNIDKLTSLFDADGNPLPKIDNRLLKLLQENNSNKTDFSFADNPIHQKKRELSVNLAKAMYKRLGDKFDVSNPEARREVQPTEEERQGIYMADMGLLEDDVDDVCNKATVILWKLLNGTPRKNLQNDFDRQAIEEEKSLEYSHIVEACIRDAFKGFKKDLDISKRVKAQEQKDAQKEIDSVKGFSTDELAINGIDLMAAISEFSETETGEFVSDLDAINSQIDAIISHCKKWADSEGVSYDLAFAKAKATLVNAFNDISDNLVYGKYVKSACKAIFDIAECKTEKALAEKSKKLGQKLAEFFRNNAREIMDDFFDKDYSKREKAKRAEKRKEKKAAEKAESKLKMLHRQAVKMFANFAKGQKLPPDNKLEITRKIPARVQAYLAQIKKVITLDEKGVKERYEYLSSRKSSLEADGEEPNYKERYEMSALMIFGNISEKSLPEILNAYSELKKLIDGAKDAQAQRLEEWEAQISEKAQPLCNALSLAGNKESAKDGLTYSGAQKTVSMFEHRLRVLFLARKGLSESRKAEIESWITDYSQRVARASIFERNLANSEMQWLQDELEYFYVAAESAFERLTKINPEWSKFASDSGRDMSLGQIMQILCTLEQWQVKEAWKQAQKKMEMLEGNPDAEIDEKFEKAYNYWKKMFSQEDAMRELLSDADKGLIRSLKLRYGQRLDTINPIYERLNGLPMISNGSNYMPIVRLGEFDIDQVQGNAISLFPSYYTPRTISLKALDENVNILQVFSQRAQTDAHFIHFGDLIFETKELLRDGDFASLLRTNLSRGEQQGFADLIRDVFSGKIKRDNTVDGKIASVIANYTAYFGLAFNLNSAMKQPTSFPAFLLKVPVKDYWGGIKELLASGELFSTIAEVWNSPFMKDRRHGGEINQILADFSRSEKECKNEPKAKRVLRRIWTKYAFAPTKYADNVAFILGGTSVYYHFLKQYRELYSEEEAKRLAMADMMNIGEMTQQSAFIMNMSEGQRQGAGFGRMFSTFRTTNQQYLSFELDAIAEAVADPSAKNIARLAKILLLNHAILPAMFNGAGMLLNLAMGDDWDDDDLDYLLKNTAISCSLDVFTGWWFGAIIKGAAQVFFLGGNKNLTDSMLPASTVARVAESVLNTAKDVMKNGFSDADWGKHFDKIGKSVFSPYRIGKKIYDNATDGDEGVLW